jgi:hypothetical protein
MEALMLKSLGGGKFLPVSESGNKKFLKSGVSKKKAKKRLKQVEWFKSHPK